MGKVVFYFTLHEKCLHQSFPSLYFPTFRLNMERYGKIRKTLNTDTFYAVLLNHELLSFIPSGPLSLNCICTQVNIKVNVFIQKNICKTACS